MSWKRSKQGLSRCTHCGSHVRGGAEGSQNRCAFCEAGPTQDLMLKPRRAPIGRSGFIAASLLAASAVGCGAESDAVEPPPQTESAPEAEPAQPEAQPEAPTPPVLEEPTAPEANADPTPEAQPPELPQPAEPPAASAYGAPPEDLDDL